MKSTGVFFVPILFVTIMSFITGVLFLRPIYVNASSGVFSHRHGEECYEMVEEICQDHRIDTDIGSKYQLCSTCNKITQHQVITMYEICNLYGYSEEREGYTECSVCMTRTVEWSEAGIFVHFTEVETKICALDEVDYGSLTLVPDRKEVSDQPVLMKAIITPFREGLVLHSLPYFWNLTGDYVSNSELVVTENGDYSCIVRTIDGMAATAMISITNIVPILIEPEPEPDPDPVLIEVVTENFVEQSEFLELPEALPDWEIVMEEVQLQQAELFIKENEPILTQPESIADPIEIIKDSSLEPYTDVQNKSSFESVITVIEYTIWLLLALVIVAYFGIWNRNRIRIYYKNERGGYTFIGRSSFTEEEGLRTLIIKDYLTERSKSTEYMIIIPAYIMKYSKRKDLLIKNYKSHIYTCISKRVYFIC